MSEEPQFPPIPAIGEILDRKERVKQKVYSVIKCDSCNSKYTRKFTPGDYTFKKLEQEKCEKCEKTGRATIIEVYAEWIDPKEGKILKI